MSLLSPAPPQNVDFLCCGGYKRELRQLRAERKAFEEASAPAPPALRVSTHDLLLLLMCLAAHTQRPASPQGRAAGHNLQSAGDMKDSSPTTR